MSAIYPFQYHALWTLYEIGPSRSRDLRLGAEDRDRSPALRSLEHLGLVRRDTSKPAVWSLTLAGIRWIETPITGDLGAIS